MCYQKLLVYSVGVLLFGACAHAPQTPRMCPNPADPDNMVMQGVMLTCAYNTNRRSKVGGGFGEGGIVFDAEDEITQVTTDGAYRICLQKACNSYNSCITTKSRYLREATYCETARREATLRQGGCSDETVCPPDHDCINKACVKRCVPRCPRNKCGGDGCGGQCPPCSPQHVCTNGVCKSECFPDCAGKECGYDGCGGTCGRCPGKAPICDVDRQCQAACAPSCAGKMCGSDGCGGQCGSCPQTAECNVDGRCVRRYPSCTADADCHHGESCRSGLCGPGTQPVSPQAPPGMVAIPAGEYVIGDDSLPNNPSVRVRLSSFQIDRHMRDKNVDWYEAKRACEQRGLRLPTEAQWETAVRRGSIEPDAKVADWVRDWYRKDAYKNGLTDPAGPSKSGCQHYPGNWKGQNGSELEPCCKVLRGGKLYRDAARLPTQRSYWGPSGKSNRNRGYRCVDGP